MKSQYPNVITFKLDDYSLTKLENYCFENGRSTSASIRDALALMFLRQDRKKRKSQGMTGNTEVDAIMKVFEQ